MEQPILQFTRKYCKKNNIKYKITGQTEALFLKHPYTNKYIQVCYCLLNLTREQVIEYINTFFNQI